MIEKQFRDQTKFVQKIVSFLLLVVISTYCSADNSQNENTLNSPPRQKAMLARGNLLELIPYQHDLLMSVIEHRGPITDDKERTLLLEKALLLRDWKSALILLDKQHSGTIDDKLDSFIEMVRSAPKTDDSIDVDVLIELYNYKLKYLKHKNRMLREEKEKPIPHSSGIPIPSEPV